MGLRGGLDRCGKIRPPPGLDPQNVKSVASLYTDNAIPPPLFGEVRTKILYVKSR